MDKGDFFGEMSILEGLPRTLSAEAVDDCELIEINSMTFDRMIRGNIEIAIRMLRKLSIRLREAERRIAEVHPSALRAVSAAGGGTAGASREMTGEANGVRLEIESSQAAFAVRADETLIGRYDPVTEQRPDIDLTDLDIKRSVSRRHARILRNAEGFAVVEEVGALNGTLVNGDPLVPGQPHLLADGDRLSVGTITMVFRI
jgi:CRP-like cAMP-binding protein